MRRLFVSSVPGEKPGASERVFAPLFSPSSAPFGALGQATEGAGRDSRGDTTHSPEGRKEEVKSICFNQDASCIAVATTRGFCIYTTDPVQKTFSRDLRRDFRASAQASDPSSSRGEGGLLIVEMLYTCNILALVGEGPGAAQWLRREQGNETETRWCRDVCVLWDDRQEKAVVQLQFHSPIRGVQMLKEVLIVILTEKVCVYRLRDLLLLDTVATAPNPSAVCACASLQSAAVPVSSASASSSPSLSSSTSSSRAAPASAGSAGRGDTQSDRAPSSQVLVACPALQTGRVQLLIYGEDTRRSFSRQDSAGSSQASCDSERSSRSSFSQSDNGIGTGAAALISSLSICAHSNDLAFLCLSPDGQLLGTASSRGTLLRVFDPRTGDFLLEFRRGSNPARITSMAFSPCCGFLAACSSTGTTHLYKLAASWTGGEQKRSRERYRALGGTRSAEEKADVGAAQKPDRRAEEANAEPEKDALKASLQFFEKLSPYFHTEWSFAQWRLPSKDCAAICAFSQNLPNTLFVVSAEGSFFQLRFDPLSGGAMTKLHAERLEAF
ncbi:WD domain-containing protein [Toxoplasma gondii VAND]|uniref:WD domain-containing protein n=1 Tax=Toxoplasma gondii VAND TaxID=933077 RepID=A0A086PIC0_TOXGO|nr:WD domain-containing protein [Toxoplasma gondii VAND]